MSLKLQRDFNPVAAYRLRGKRYAIYTGGKLAMVLAILSLALITLAAPLTTADMFDRLFRVAMQIIYFVVVLAPWVAFEAIHWWHQGRQERRAGANLQSPS